MEFLIVVLILVGVLGLFWLLFFFLDGLLIVEPLEKLEYIAQMGIVLAPCIVMSSNELGEPYTFKTWTITFGLMLACLLLTLFLRIFIECIEDYADRRQIKKQKKNKKKVVKNLLGKKAANKLQDKLYIEKAEDTNTTSNTKEKRKIRATFAIQLAKAKGATLSAAVFAPFVIALNAGIDKLLDPLCILTVLLGIGVSLLCGWISQKILPDI